MLCNPCLGSWPAMPDRVHRTQARVHTTVIDCTRAAYRHQDWTIPPLAGSAHFSRTKQGFCIFPRDLKLCIDSIVQGHVGEHSRQATLSLMWHSAQLGKGQGIHCPCCRSFENIRETLIYGIRGITLWALLHWYMMHARQARAARCAVLECVVCQKPRGCMLKDWMVPDLPQTLKLNVFYI